MMAVDVLNAASVVSGLVAAALWFRSTKVRVEPDPNENGFTIVDEKPGHKNVDVLKTIERQIVWNSWAAMATAIAVGLQAVSLSIQHFLL